MSWFGWGAATPSADEAEGIVIPGLEAPETEEEFRALVEKKIAQMNELLADPDWSPLAFDDGGQGVLLWDKPPVPDGGSEVSMLRSEMTVAAPVDRVHKLLNSLDTEVLKTYDDTVIEVRVLKEVTEDIQVISRHVQSPFPISNREVVALRYSKKNPVDGSAVIIGSSINLRGMPETSGFVRANAIVAAWSIVPLDESRTRVSRLAQIDPRGQIPAAITNTFKLKLGQSFLKVKTVLEQAH